MRSILNLIQDLSLYTFDIENYDTEKYTYILQKYNKYNDNYSYINLGTYISHTNFAVKLEDAFGVIKTYMFNDLRRMTILRYKKVQTNYAKVYENANNQYQVTCIAEHNKCILYMSDICHIQNADTHVQYFQYNDTLVTMYEGSNETVYTFRPVLHVESNTPNAKNLRVALPFIMNHNDKIQLALNFCKYIYGQIHLDDTVLIEVRRITQQMDKSEIYNLRKDKNVVNNIVSESTTRLANYIPEELLKEYNYTNDVEDNTNDVKRELELSYKAAKLNNVNIAIPEYGYDDNDLVIDILNLQICIPMSEDKAENIMDKFEEIEDDKLFDYVYDCIMNELNISKALCVK